MALLARVGLAEQSERACCQLSYGDLKRVELAMALSGKPKILLMDEPTSGMAPGARHQLMALVAEITRMDRIAVLFTEHDMDVVFGYADRVQVIAHGETLAVGMPEEVRSNPLVQEIYLGTV